ncbi:hypothetical protein Ancab_010265 [Ancistrocladus abbreviatus]
MLGTTPNTHKPPQHNKKETQNTNSQPKTTVKTKHGFQHQLNQHGIQTEQKQAIQAKQIQTAHNQQDHSRGIATPLKTTASRSRAGSTPSAPSTTTAPGLTKKRSRADSNP